VSAVEGTDGIGIGTDFAVKSDVSSMGMGEDKSETRWRWVGTEIKSTEMNGLGCKLSPMQVRK